VRYRGLSALPFSRCIRTCVFTHMQIHTHARTHILDTHAHACTNLHVHPRTRTRTHFCTCAYPHAHECSRRHMHTHLRTHSHLKWREERRGVISWTVCRSRRVFSKRVAEKILDIVFHLLSHRLAILLSAVLLFRER